MKKTRKSGDAILISAVGGGIIAYIHVMRSLDSLICRSSHHNLS
jgi:hypothetical protein